MHKYDFEIWIGLMAPHIGDSVVLLGGAAVIATFAVVAIWGERDA